MKSSGRGSRRKTAIRVLTWKDMVERRTEVMDTVAHEVSWAKAGGTNRFVRLYTPYVQARLAKKSFLFGHLFFNITNVFCAKKRVGHLDGKNVFQCFWSDPKTRVFGCFGASQCFFPRRALY